MAGSPGKNIADGSQLELARHLVALVAATAGQVHKDSHALPFRASVGVLAHRPTFLSNQMKQVPPTSKA